MYMLILPSGASVSFPTLGDVFFFLNRRRDPDEEQLLGNADKMEVWTSAATSYEVVQRNSSLGIKMTAADGSAQEIMLRLLDEVMPYALGTTWQPKLPWQMTMAEWGAVHSVHSVAYSVIPCLTQEQRSERCTNSAGQQVSLTEFVNSEFMSRLGYGGNGPEYRHGAGSNCRHEVHVAYALARGDNVPASVLVDYADWPKGYDLRFFPELLAKPYLRGRISGDRLSALLTMLRTEGSKVKEITEENAPFLISLMNKVPEDASYAIFDDVLYEAGVLEPRQFRPQTIDLGAPVSEFATSLRELVLSNRIKERRQWLDEQVAQKRMSKREVNYELQLIANYPNQEPYTWGNKMAAAIDAKAVGFLLEILDGPRNESSKKAIAKHYGIKLHGVPAAQRRRGIFQLCGYISDADYQAAETAYAAKREAVTQAAEAERERKRAETLLDDTREIASRRIYNVNGVMMNGAEFVEKIVLDGYTALEWRKRGAAREYILKNPQTSSFYKLNSKDGVLDYARAYLAQQPVAA